MSIRSDLQYYADIEFLNKLALINYGLNKNAGMIEDAFSNMWSGALSEVKGLFSTVMNGTPEEKITAVLNAIAPLAAGSILGPFGGVAVELAQVFGVDIAGVLKSIFTSIKDMIFSGKSVDTDIANNLTMQALGGLVSNSSDLFLEFRTAMDDGLILKYALFGTGSLMKALFSLPKFVNLKGHFFGGLITFLVKTVLKGLGLMTLTGAVKGLVGGKPGQQAMQQQDPKEENTTSLPPIISHNYKPSGFGETEHTNNNEKAFYLPITGDIKQTLTNFATQVYQELKGRESEIQNTSSFKQMVNILNGFISGGDYIEMPNGINSIKQLVDRFVGEVPKKVK
jgi:hypothetical protein